MKKIKILKKSKEGVLLANKKELTWEQFNFIFTIDSKDKTIAIVRPEKEKEFEETESLFNDLTAMVMASRVDNDPQTLITISFITDKLMKGGFSLPDIQAQVQTRIATLTEALEKQAKAEEAAKAAREAAMIKQEQLHTISVARFTIGSVKGAEKLLTLFK